MLQPTSRQQMTNQYRPARLPGHPAANARLPKPRTGKPGVKITIAALALTAFFVIGPIQYIAAYARIARNEYRRQALARELRELRSKIINQRMRLDSLRSRDRIMAFAQEQNMEMANLADDVVFLPAPAAGDRVGSDRNLGTSWAATHKARVAATLSSLFARRGGGTGRAEASTLTREHPRR
jgi:hypothetical protein